MDTLEFGRSLLQTVISSWLKQKGKCKYDVIWDGFEWRVVTLQFHFVWTTCWFNFSTHVSLLKQIDFVAQFKFLQHWLGDWSFCCCVKNCIVSCNITLSYNRGSVCKIISVCIYVGTHSELVSNDRSLGMHFQTGYMYIVQCLCQK